MSFFVRINGRSQMAFEKPVTGSDILKRMGSSQNRKIVAWHVNHYLRPLSWVVEEAAEVDFVDTSSFEGMAIYRSTLSFLLVIVAKKALGTDVFIRHSISDGYFCEFADGAADEERITRLRRALEDLVSRDVPIETVTLPLDKARKVFENQGNASKANLLHWTGVDPVMTYRCEGEYGYFYVPLAPSASYVDSFGIVSFDDGFVLRFPTVSSPRDLPPFRPPKKLAEVFQEYSQWLDILDVGTMESLHRHVTAGRARELILVSEALHSQRLNYLAEEVSKSEKVRLVCIAGPSGSGKTTSANRLAIHLTVCGMHPLIISLDDYFLDREKTPRDEEGNYDFESIEALDVNLVNEHLENLLEGATVRLPKFNFVTGKREKGPERALGPKGVIIVEGIHGLNDRLFRNVARSSVFKIYVSPLTGISLDTHNRTSTTDNRLLRRLVRDYRLRAKDAETTLKQWPSVIRGAQQYIFPYQEGADEMFNSALVYELSVLKGYVEPLLRTIKETSPVYGDAQRLLGILRFIPFIPSDTVPNDSILREFIGGSGFDV
ncbi:MAG: nucleoside kinase [Thermovirgaceae bacterium]